MTSDPPADSFGRTEPIYEGEAADYRNPARSPHFERVRTDAGWHGRIVGANGETVWTTEVYERGIDVTHALNVFYRYALTGHRHDRDVDNRTDAQ